MSRHDVELRFATSVTRGLGWGYTQAQEMLSRELSPCLLGRIPRCRKMLVKPVRSGSACIWPQIWVEIEESFPAVATVPKCAYLKPSHPHTICCLTPISHCRQHSKSPPTYRAAVAVDQPWWRAEGYAFTLAIALCQRTDAGQGPARPAFLFI